MGVEITGKVLGAIGCCNIGLIAADRAQGLKMKVIAFVPVPVAGARAKDISASRSRTRRIVAIRN